MKWTEYKNWLSSDYHIRIRSSEKNQCNNNYHVKRDDLREDIQVERQSTGHLQILAWLQT